MINGPVLVGVGLVLYFAIKLFDMAITSVYEFTQIFAPKATRKRSVRIQSFIASLLLIALYYAVLSFGWQLATGAIPR